MITTFEAFETIAVLDQSEEFLEVCSRAPAEDEDEDEEYERF